MDECEHDFRCLDYSKLLECWITYCSKCGRVKNPEPISERLQRAINSRIRNGDIKK